MAEGSHLPARRVGDEWRFLKSALVEWLRRKPTPKEVLLQQAGALADDDTLPELLASIYKARGRPERVDLGVRLLPAEEPVVAATWMSITPPRRRSVE